MKRELKWLHVWEDRDGLHIAIQRGNRHRTYYQPSRASAMRLSGVAFKLYIRKHGAFVPSLVGLGWSWRVP